MSTYGSTYAAIYGNFPLLPIGVEADLYLGAWTDATSYIYQRNPIAITRGRQSQSTTMAPSQCTATFNNRDGRFTTRNPAGAWYGSLVQNTPFRVSVPNSLTGGGTYLRIEDDTESYASTPDSAALQITGNIDLRIDVAPSGYQACTLAYKWGGTGQAWQFLLNGDGTLTFTWYDGTNSHTVTSTQPLPYLGRIMIEVQFLASGSVQFYTAPQMGGTRTQLGASVAFGAASVISAAAGQPVVVGHNAADLGTSPQSVTGQIYEFRIFNSSSALVADPVFTAQTAGTTSFTDAQSNTWTLNTFGTGTAEISGKSYRYHGELASLPKATDPSLADLYSDGTASGIMRRLTQQQSPLHSALYRAYVRLTGSTAPVAYWPCEDAAGAVSLGSALPGGSPMSINGTPTLSSSSAFNCSAQLPEVQSSTWSGSVNSPAGTTWNANVIRFLLTETAGTIPNGATIMSVYTTGTIRRLDLQYGNGGTIQLAGYDVNSSQLFASGYVGFAIDGGLWRISLELTPSGGNVKWDELTDAPGAPTGLQYSGTLSSASIGAVTKVVVNPGGAAMGSAVIGHITVADTWDTIYDVAQPLNAWLGETAGNRFARLCGEEGISSRIVGFPNVSTAMGYQTLQTLSQLLTECETTDMGMMFEPRTCLGLGYVTRTALYNQAPDATVSFSGAQIVNPFTPTSDDLAVINDVTMTNADGSSARQVLTSGAMSTASPPAGIGRVDTSITVNAAYDSGLASLAMWKLWVSTVNDDRYPQISFNMARPETPDTIALLDIGAYLQVTGTPSWVPPGPVRQLCAGFTETLGPAGVWEIDVNGTPEAPYEVAVAGTGATDSAHADTDGSTLAGPVTSSATSLSVVTTNPLSPVWTSNGSDFPFDILIGGERVTVTACTPLSSWLTGQNLLTTNAGIGNWAALNNCAVAVSSVHNLGTGSLAMTSAASGNMTAGSCSNASYATQATPCNPGDSIACAGYMQAAATPDSCAAGATFFQANGTVISSLFGTAVADTTSGWTLVAGTVTAPALSAWCRATFRVTASAASEVHYVNDVAFADTTSNTQQMTVTRSVNGVAKTQTAGTSLALFSTPVAAL